MTTTKDFGEFIQSQLDADPTLKREVELERTAMRLAQFPTRSTKHMDHDERSDGIAQMIADLDQLAKADGCIAAAWAAEFVRFAAEKLNELATWSDRPTCPGMWVCMPTEGHSLSRPTVLELDEDDLSRGAPFHTSRVYGPIPE